MAKVGAITIDSVTWKGKGTMYLHLDFDSRYFRITGNINNYYYNDAWAYLHVESSNSDIMSISRLGSQTLAVTLKGSQHEERTARNLEIRFVLASDRPWSMVKNDIYKIQDTEVAVFGLFAYLSYGSIYGYGDYVHGQGMPTDRNNLIFGTLPLDEDGSISSTAGGEGEAPLFTAEASFLDLQGREIYTGLIDMGTFTPHADDKDICLLDVSFSNAGGSNGSHSYKNRLLVELGHTPLENYAKTASLDYTLTVVC